MTPRRLLATPFAISAHLTHEAALWAASVKATTKESRKGNEASDREELMPGTVQGVRSELEKNEFVPYPGDAVAVDELLWVVFDRGRPSLIPA